MTFPMSTCAGKKKRYLYETLIEGGTFILEQEKEKTIKNKPD